VWIWLPKSSILCHSVTRTNNWNKFHFDSEKRFQIFLNGYCLCRSNWLIVIKAWSSLIENVHFWQSLVLKGHTWTCSLFCKCHDLIHFFWHFLCHKEGTLSVPFSSNFKLVLLQIIVINVIKSYTFWICMKLINMNWENGTENVLHYNKLGL